jgi:hypothetical protein
MSNEVIQLWMHERFTSADHKDGEPQIREMVNPLLHHNFRHRRGKVIEFIAICAGKIASAHGDYMSEDGMPCRGESTTDHHEFA